MSKIGTSQNGWPVYDDTDHFTRVKVEGVGFWAANSDVAVVLADFAQKFNDRIESINLKVNEDPGYDDWSYAVRPVRGQTTGYSNHGSATAWDLNSTRHPRGVTGTYSSADRKRLRDLIDEYDGVLRHGEFYSNVIDGMHVEINAGASAVKRMADKIREKNDVLNADDKKWLEAKIKSAVLDVLQNEKFIPNITTDTKENLGDMTVEAALRLGDFKDDRTNEKLDAIIKLLTPTTATKAK